MVPRSVWLLLVLIVGALLSISHAHAADPAAAESLFRRGKDLMKEGKLEEACDAFQASMKADASGGTLLNLALCHQKRGMTATAWAEYKRAIPMFRGAGEPKRMEAARDLAADLESKLSKLTIVVEAPVEGLVVDRDGQPVEEAYFGTPVAIDPGTYRIEATATGYEGWSTNVDIGLDGDHRTVTVPALQPAGQRGVEPSPDPVPADDGEGSSGLLVAGVIVGSVGLVVAVIGGVMGGLVLSDASDAESDAELCPNQVCTTAGREAIDSAESKAMVANIMIPVGAAAAVGGLVMILLGASDDGGGTDDGTSAAGRISVTPTAGPYGGGLQLQATF